MKDKNKSKLGWARLFKRERGKEKLSKSTIAKKMYEKETKGTKAGSGERFKAMVKSLEYRGDVKNPKAVAAAIGRKKYGKKKMTAWAVAAKKKKEEVR